MITSSSVAKAVHLSDPAVTDYAFRFKVFEAAHLAVSVVDAETYAVTVLGLDADYSVTGLGDDSGGAVVLTEAGQARAGTGNSLVILRNMPIVQGVDYRPHDIFPAEVHEMSLDKIIMMIQELFEQIGRAIIAPPNFNESIQYGDLMGLLNQTTAARDEAVSGAEEAAEAARAAKVSEDLARAAAEHVDGVIDEIKNLTAEAETLEPGDLATAAYDPATGVLLLGLPRGATGADGREGPAGKDGVDGVDGADGKDGSGVNILGVKASEADLPAVGNVGDAWMIGENLWVWDVADSAWVNAGPIRGPQGPAGADGRDGADGQDGAAGQDGQDGAAAAITVGTVTTGAVGSNATVNNSGSSAAAVFDFVIPKGDKGDPGEGGGGFNSRQVVTTTGTFTAQENGWHKLTLVGAGGAGGKGGSTSSGLGGAQGGTTSVLLPAGAKICRDTGLIETLSTDTSIAARGGSGGGGGAQYGSGGGGEAGVITEVYVYLLAGVSVSMTIGARSATTTGTTGAVAGGNGNGPFYGFGGTASGVGGGGAAGAGNGGNWTTNVGGAPGGSGGVNGSPFGFGSGGGGGGGASSNANLTTGQGGIGGPGASSGTRVSAGSATGGNGGAGGPGGIIIEYSQAV